VLTLWARNGKIRSILLPGGTERKHRLYDINSLKKEENTVPCIPNRPIKEEPTRKFDAIYARVSTKRQAPYLQNQLNELKQQYPEARVFSDIASGINFKRRGLRVLLEHALAGRVSKVYLTHRDRLARIAYDLVEWLLKLHGTEIVLSVGTQSTETESHPEGEFVEDLISIVTVFGARLYGARSGSSRKRALGDDKHPNGIPQSPDKRRSVAVVQVENVSGSQPTEGTESLVRSGPMGIQPDRDPHA
jgi:predicted site-specific integrase-resolvase